MEMFDKEVVSNFNFLEKNFPFLAKLAKTSESYIYSDPPVALFRIRLFGEKLTEYIFNEHKLPSQTTDSFHTKLKYLFQERIVPQKVTDLLFQLKKSGNDAAHNNLGDSDEALQTVISAFKVGKWLEETYGDTPDLHSLQFNPPSHSDPKHTIDKLAAEIEELEKKFNALLEERKNVSHTDEYLKLIKFRSEKAALKIEMDEAETRKLIDKQLVEAGWLADSANLNYHLHKTLPQKGKNIAIAEWHIGQKRADYALFIGKKLVGIVEAKKYNQDISGDLHQAATYAKLADAVHDIELTPANGYKVPFLFAANGRKYLEQIKTKSGVWFWDVRSNTNVPRALQGFFSPEGILKMLAENKEQANRKLLENDMNFLASETGLRLRKYQIEAIRKIEDKIINDTTSRRALVAMATGTGKTRTIIGLCYRLIATERFRRILFLVDRKALADQALDAFKDNRIVDGKNLSDIYHISDLKKTIPDVESRLHFATVQGMVKRLFYNSDEVHPLPINTYDCIIVDEAHRGYFHDKEIDDDDLFIKDQRDYVSKYRMVLDYFDAYAIALTATPALQTVQIFGHPVYSYYYREAVIDGYLVDHDPPYNIMTKLNTEGIHWLKGEKPKVYDSENNEIIELTELEDELAFDVEGFNKMVLNDNFNQTVVDELIKHIDPLGLEKTLIFAATDNHADTIVSMLRNAYAEAEWKLPPNAIEKITGSVHEVDKLIKQYKNEKFPTIAVTVDLLTTGIDVPAICHLVFMRRIKSRILYEQMKGRATRRCPEINKEAFHIYDAVRLYEIQEEFTNMKPVVANPSISIAELSTEFEFVQSEEHAKRKLEELVAKLRRKKNLMNNELSDIFKLKSGGKNMDELIEQLLEQPVSVSANQVKDLGKLWLFMDQIKKQAKPVFYSEHEDVHLVTERGYGYGRKPEDYLKDFETFVKDNMNQISALKIICTKPRELDRKSLHELKLILISHGYTEENLKAAWSDTRNETVMADIISFVRTMALGDSLISYETRVRNAMTKVYALKKWTALQQKWLTRIENQLLAEHVLHTDDLNDQPFADQGGYNTINKIFENKVDEIINIINDSLYSGTA